MLYAVMPSACGFTWSPELDALIREEAAAQAVPLDLAYTFVGAESGFDPRAHHLSALEDSVGLLQLNRRGGQGQGYSVEQHMDPRLNLRVGLPAIRRAFEQVWSANIEAYEFIYQVATRSGHPGPVARGDARILRIAQIWACFYPAAGLSLMGPGPTPAAVGGPASLLAAPFLLLAASLGAPTQMVLGLLRRTTRRTFTDN